MGEPGSDDGVARARDHLRFARQAPKRAGGQQAVTVSEIAGFGGGGCHTEHPYNLRPKRATAAGTFPVPTTTAAVLLRCQIDHRSSNTPTQDQTGLAEHVL
jgi:hypothetical protein